MKPGNGNFMPFAAPNMQPNFQLLNESFMPVFDPNNTQGSNTIQNQKLLLEMVQPYLTNTIQPDQNVLPEMVQVYQDNTMYSTHALENGGVYINSSQANTENL